MILATVEKQPADVLDYDVAYDQWLTEDDTVQSATAEVDLPGLTVDLTYINPTFVKVWLSGGADGVTYKVTVTSVTQGGRTKQDEFKVKVKEV